MTFADDADQIVLPNIHINSAVHVADPGHIAFLSLSSGPGSAALSIGPMASLQSFEVEDDTMALGSHPSYGLCAGLFAHWIMTCPRAAGNPADWAKIWAAKPMPQTAERNRS